MGRKKKAEKEEVYHVEVITKARVNDDGEWEYFVKWADYGSDADSWEPQENVQQCNRLLTSFWKHIGTDNDDYPIGYEVAAEQRWIDKEKRYFQETFVKSSKRKSDKASFKDRQDKQQSKSALHASERESSADESTGSEENASARAPTAKKLSKTTRIVDTESESESDDTPHERAKVSSHPKDTAPKIPVLINRPETLSVGGPASVAPPRVNATRTHQDQRANPLVKPMGLSSKSVEAGSSLSTKQRIAAGIRPPPTGPKPLPPAPKTSLTSLSFKKNKPPVPVNVQNKDVATSAAMPTATIQPTDDADVVASPDPMDIDQPVDLFDSVLDDDDAPPGGSMENFVAAIPSKAQEEITAEKFLQTINIPMLDDPLETGAMADQPDQSATELGKIPAIAKIPKKWKWSGELYISTSKSKTELLCTVTIADPSNMSNSSHINLLLSSLDSLRISKLYPIMDLSPLFRACGKPQYFGRLDANEPNENVIIHGLEQHLTNEGLAAVITLLLDGTEAAILVIFPEAQQGLRKVLQVPEHLLSGTPLLVVLLPFLMASTHLSGQKSIKAVIQSSSILQDVPLPSDLSQQAVLYQAMSLLSFPKTLLDFLHNSTTSRPYCIWPYTNHLSPDLDTAMLQCILKSSKAIPAKLEEEVRIVFISNRHLDTLHTMPSLVTKRIDSPEIQFWTYGYSASITQESWRVQEIYPLGGIITFTSSALAEDFVGCHQLMLKTIEHPLWECYLVPEVLAVSCMLCGDGDLNLARESCLDPILGLISLGSISMMRMPGDDYSDQLAWLSQVFSHCSAGGQELLENSFKVLKTHPTTSDMTVEELVEFTNNEITKDLMNAQIQPAFMKSYRRFVVIRAACEDSIPFNKNGLEWSSLSSFSFKDDYFQI